MHTCIYKIAIILGTAMMGGMVVVALGSCRGGLGLVLCSSQHKILFFLLFFIYLFYFFSKLQLQKNKQENIHNVTIMLQIMLQH